MRVVVLQCRKFVTLLCHCSKILLGRSYADSRPSACFAGPSKNAKQLPTAIDSFYARLLPALEVRLVSPLSDKSQYMATARAYKSYSVHLQARLYLIMDSNNLAQYLIRNLAHAVPVLVFCEATDQNTIS